MTENTSNAEREDPVLPLKLHGAEFSYFTGKLEGALRYMELPYRRLRGSPTGEAAEKSGVYQIPTLELADGRLLTDTTPIIAWLDERYPERAITPRNPVLRFFSRLLEDYSDEWMWRPAMHYRWNYDESAKHLTRVLLQEHAADLPLPPFLMRRLFINRQRTLFIKQDGVTPETWDHVEQTYHRILSHLNAIFDSRPYLLGDRPSLADIGFFGPMFRHFAQDPTSARIMRETAPAVHEWTARLWNARQSRTSGPLLAEIPDDWTPILRDIGSAYLPYLAANAEAWQAGEAMYDVEIEGAPYRSIRTSPYRVWCLEELRRNYTELSPPDQQEVRTLLEAHDCWEPLWRGARIESGVDPDNQLPFAGGCSMTGLPAKEAVKPRLLPVDPVRSKRN
ncbi:MAG: glutathione S-transferase family protein [Myxococcota bacterium]